ncbi:hypothetical protein Z517_10027 [Fonsecaea pedrosoi CBS 271.37]|uniref:RRM domain-containing protein n=1 Tax=Fonsecaea pedrosoi CBS 271.37 TaxID=1442368 RepID=A0A0D2DIW0_9EURO|nr:uncharacterized protein Z517_10027 [Fonsecaea pedrosoi CBS 271.37]KIW77581.1 hypothetical protein Z517_10027 [Fonsecaea pedrosoi CBS 271.37]
MSKVKSKSVPSTGSKPGVLSKVKGAAVSKPSQSVKAKSKEIAKEVAAKEQKKDKKNKKVPVKEPTPEPESSSEEEESEDSASSEEDSETEEDVKTNGASGVKVDEDDSEDDSSEESDSEASSSEDEAPKSNGAVSKTKPAAKASESEEEDDDSSEEESEEEKPAAKGAKIGKTAVEEDDDESEESSDESDSDEEAAPPKAAKTAKANGVKAAESSDEDDDSDDSSEGDQSSDDSEESDEEAEAKPAKRKAEDVEEPAAKKTKVEEDGSRGSILFVGNLSWNVDEEWLKSEFEQFGELGGVRLITQREDGRSKGYGYVEFVNAADAAKAHVAKQGYELDGRVMNVDFANKKPDAGDKQEKRRQSYGDALSEPSDTLFLGNLSFEITEDDVYNIFAPYGNPTGVRIPTDKDTGNVKGYGYVTFATLDEAKSALEGAQGSYVKNRPMRVDYAQPRQQNGDAPARGGGFGGGFGGRGGRGGPRGGRGGGRDFGGRGGRGGGRGGPRGGARGGRGGTTNRGGFGDFSGKKTTF